MIAISFKHNVADTNAFAENFRMSVEALLAGLAQDLNYRHKIESSGKGRDIIIFRTIVIECPTAAKAADFLLSVYDMGICGAEIRLKDPRQYQKLLAVISGKNQFLGVHLAGVFEVWLGKEGSDDSLLLQRSELEHLPDTDMHGEPTVQGDVESP